MKEPKLFYLPSQDPLPPAKSAIVDCSLPRRWRISWHLSTYFHGNMTLIEYLFFKFVPPAVFILLAAPAVAYLAVAFLDAPILDKLAEIIDPRPFFPSSRHAAIWLLYLVGACLFWRLALGLRMRGVDTPSYEFDAHQAAEISQQAGEILKRHLSKDALVKLTKLREHAAEPYLIVRGLAPVPDVFPIKPDKTRKRDLSARKCEQVKHWTRIIDSAAGGLLHLLGTEPAPRFADDAADEKLVIDKYTRTDVQELPDMQQDDVFLRFHQSTIERPFKRACWYKIYMAISNLRLKPIYLLRVSDIIECLENKNGKYSEAEHEEIFWNSPNLDRNNVVRTLMDDKYQRQPPRAIRFLKGDDKEVGRRIIKTDETGKYIMAFDPARVWVHSSGSSLHAEAILALRWAIHLASRKEVREIKLRSRDVLIVDNRRVMIARREDKPFVTWRDILITLIARIPYAPDFSGWWLRVVFGYPIEPKDEVSPKRRHVGNRLGDAHA